nr:unnamed protein product [Callosobruchus chinensis]
MSMSTRFSRKLKMWLENRLMGGNQLRPKDHRNAQRTKDPPTRKPKLDTSTIINITVVLLLSLFEIARAHIIIEALNNVDRRDDRLRNARLHRAVREHNPVMDLSDNEFKAHYRLTKDLFPQLCGEISPYLPRPRRRTAISVECKVLTTLSFHATGSYPKPLGMSYLHGLSQSGVSNTVREVTNAFNHPNILRRFIRFPQTVQKRQAIINGYICDSNLNVLNVDATFGGATHDAHIWKNSEILYQHGFFIGDSAYPLRPWLLTPIVNAEPNTPDEHYTNLHTTCRNTVERCIGVMKARWRCLLAHRVLHYDHHMVAKIINACTILHNICNRYRGLLFHYPPTTVQLLHVLRHAVKNLQEKSESNIVYAVITCVRRYIDDYGAVLLCNKLWEQGSTRPQCDSLEYQHKHRTDLNELSRIRRQSWLRAIKRVDLDELKLKYAYVCSRHFITGKSAALTDNSISDWIPSLNMGYKPGSTTSTAVKLERYKRSEQRRMKQVRVSIMKKVQKDILGSLVLFHRK